MKFPCTLVKQRGKQIYANKNSWQQGSRGIHSQAEHQAYSAPPEVLRALQCRQLDGDPVNFLALTKFNFFDKDLQNEHG